MIYMRVWIEDLSCFIEKPPTIDSMIYKEKDLRKRRNRILIVVPCLNENYRLKHFLKKASEQKARNFDVCLILAKNDRFIKGNRIPLYQIKRKWDFGFAGAVYLGQKIALRDKYEYFLFTDIDRVFHKRDSLSVLYKYAKKIQADIVCGKSRMSGYFLPEVGYEEVYLGERRFIPLFCLIKTKLLEKVGFYALPLYMGYDEMEFETRLFTEIKKTQFLEEVVSDVYVKPYKYVFINIVKKNFIDHQYIYEFVLCTTKWIQTINRLNFIMKMKAIFFGFLTFRFMQLRIPCLKIIDKMAQNGKFGKIRIYNVSSLIKYEKYEQSRMKDISLKRPKLPLLLKFFDILCMVVFSYKKQFLDNNSLLIEFFLIDSFYVYSEGEKKFFFFEWKTKVTRIEKIKMFLLTIIEACLLLIKSEIVKIMKAKTVFWRYGL